MDDSRFFLPAGGDSSQDEAEEDVKAITVNFHAVTLTRVTSELVEGTGGVIPHHWCSLGH